VCVAGSQVPEPQPYCGALWGTHYCYPILLTQKLNLCEESGLVGVIRTRVLST
jgi:hypothetical protein